MNHRKDIELINSIKNADKDSNECLQELIERHSGIFITFVHSFYIPLKTKKELIDDKEYHIYQTALKYNEEKNTKFSTYLGVEARYLCLNTYNNLKKVEEVNIEPYTNTIPFYDGEICEEDKDSINEVLSMTRHHPDSRVGKIFELRYKKGDKNKLLPWSKVSPHVGLSVQGSINVHDQAIQSIRKKLKKEI